MHDLAATVVAISTPPGRGGIACVRISGENSTKIAKRIFRPKTGAPAPGGRPCFGRFLARDGRPMDHGFLVVFPRGASFTGEPTVEAWTHGSPPVLDELVEGAVAAGAVHAEPGEFTYRAVRNGRLDLTRAEAVRDLIQSRTLFQARVALAQAEGSVVRVVGPLRERLADRIARTQAAVEFVEEEETQQHGGELEREIAVAAAECGRLLEGFRDTGRIVREGARVVIAGRPNAGKSSLFNRLLRRDRAIVTEIAGTTRDTLEDDLDLDGIPVRLVDTAGLRDAADRVETEGVRRALEARSEADLVLHVVDATVGMDDGERATIAAATGTGESRPTLLVWNKVDCHRSTAPAGAWPVSAMTGAGIDALLGELRARLTGGAVLEHPIITNGRQARAIESAKAALEAAQRAASSGMSEELVLEDLGLAMRHLGSITGEFTTEEMYDRIFAQFCIGK